MATKEVGIRVRLEGGKAVVVGLQEIAAAAASVGSQSAGATAGSTQQSAALDGVAQSAARATKELEQTGGAAAAVSTAAADTAKAVGAAARELSETGNAAAEVGKKAGTAAAGSARQAKALDEVRREAGRAAKSLTEGAGASAEFSNAVGRMAQRAAGLGPLGIAIGATVAAVASLGTAVLQAQKEQADLANALIRTGNAAGVTTGQLRDMQRGLSSWNTTQGAAAKGLQAMITAGVTGRETLQQYTQVALDWSRATGDGVDTVARQFASLQGEPLAAVLKLNDGQNFLTLETYNAIKALDDQGRTIDATRLAQDAYADALATRSAEMEGNLGTVKRAWNAVAQAAKNAWDKMLNTGRAATLNDQLADTFRQIRELDRADATFGNSLLGQALGGGRNEKVRAALQATADELQRQINLREKLAGQEAERNARTQAGIAFTNAAATAEQRRTAEMNKRIGVIRAAGETLKLKPEEIEAAIAAVRAEYDKTTASAAKHATGTASVASAYDRIMQSIGAVVARQQQELASGDKLSAADRLRIQVLQQLDAAGGKVTKTQRAQVLAALDMAAAGDKEIKTAQALAAAQAQQERDRQRAGEAALRQAAGMEQSNEQLRREIEGTGKSRSELLELERARTQTHIAELQNQLDARLSTDLLDEQTAGIARQIDALRERLGLLDAKDLAQAQADWNRTVTDMGQQFTDALINGGASVRDALKRMFQSMVLRPVVAPIMAGVAGLLMPGTAGAQVGAGGGLGGSISSLSSLASMGSTAYGLLTGGAASGASSLVGAAGGDTLGAFLGASGMVAPTSSTAAFLGAAGMGIGGALGGYALGSMLSGGYSALGNANVSNIGGAAIGTAIGTMILPGVGSLVGGLIGGIADGAVNRLFGHKYDDTHFQGTFTPDGFSGVERAHYKGGLFSSSKDRFPAADPTMAAAVSAAWHGVTGQVTQFAAALGQESDAIRGINLQFRPILLDGIDDAGFAQGVQDAVSASSNEMASLVIGAWDMGLDQVKAFFASTGKNTPEHFDDAMASFFAAHYTDSPFARAGEDALATLTRLATSLAGVNAQFDVLGLTLFQGSLAGADLASNLADMLGGMDQFNAATTSYFQNFYSAQEQQDALQRQLQAGFAAVNLTMPATRAGFRDLVDGLDLTRESSQRTFAALMAMQGSFAAWADAQEQAADAARQAAEQQQADIAALYADVGPQLADILTSGLLGTFDGASVGASMAEATTNGILSAIAGGFAQQITGIITQGIVQPVVAAAVTGADVSAAVSAASINEMVAQAQRVAQVAAQVLAELKSSGALDEISKAVGSISISVPRVTVATQTYTTAVKRSTSAADAAARAAQQLADAWQRVSDTLMDEVARIRGLTPADAGQGTAYFEAQLAIATAQARAGDIDAAGRLTEISRNLLQAAATEADSQLELRRIRAQVAASLEMTAGVAAGYAQNGGGSASNSRVAPVVPPRAQASTRAPAVVVQTDPDLSREMRRLNELVERLGAELIDVNERMLRQQQSWEMNGLQVVMA